jgi:hypothetical protein
MAGFIGMIFMPLDAHAGKEQRHQTLNDVRNGTTTPQNQQQERYVEAARNRANHQNQQGNQNVNHEKRHEYVEEARDRADDGIDNDTPSNPKRERYLDAARNRYQYNN